MHQGPSCVAVFSHHRRLQLAHTWGLLGSVLFYHGLSAYVKTLKIMLLRTGTLNKVQLN